MPDESAREHYFQLQRETAAAYLAWQKSENPPISPDTEVWVTRTLEVTKKMMIKDLALQIREPVFDLIKDGSVKDAGNVIENKSHWIDKESVSGEVGWETESDCWTVTRVK